MTAQRVQLPSSLACEESLVCGLLLGDWTPAIFSECEPPDFFYDHLRRTYEACQWLAERGDPVSIASACWALVQRGTIDDVRWKGQEAEELLTNACLRHWRDVLSMYPLPAARMVRDYAERRRMVTEAQRLMRAARPQPAPPRQERTQRGGGGTERWWESD